MRIGSFFMVLLAALVALGFLLSDSLHLREDIAFQQTEIERLTQTVRQVEQEKQNALVALQAADQNLQSCRQEADQSMQAMARLSEENAYLKEQNRLLAARLDMTPSSDNPAMQATTLGLVVFAALGFGSIAVAWMKGFWKNQKRVAKSGSYVFLTEAEIKEVIKRRRESSL